MVGLGAVSLRYVGGSFRRELYWRRVVVGLLLFVGNEQTAALVPYSLLSECRGWVSDARCPCAELHSVAPMSSFVVTALLSDAEIAATCCCPEGRYAEDGDAG